jgi:hyperosmotically inducible periplasmic protein
MASPAIQGYENDDERKARTGCRDSDVSKYSAVSAVSALVLVVTLVALCAVACSHAVSTTLDDAAITAAVKTVLLNDEQISGWTIDVETAQGIVTLSGTVRSSLEEQRAIELVRGVNGVRDVRSQLQLVSAATPQS